MLRRFAGFFMPTQIQIEMARHFLALHSTGKILVLLNAWDAASARIFEESGCAAIGTSSAAIAFSLGYPDGQAIPRGEMVAAVRKIARAVRIPVTADMEAGFGETPEEVARTAEEVISAGAVGMNLEDAIPDRPGALYDLPLQIERIHAVTETAARAGIPFVLNARTDAFWLGIGPPENRLNLAVERLNAYRAAGAQCLFVPGAKDKETIGQLARRVRGPLNILGGAGTPSVGELESLGVARVSVGSGPARAAMGLTSRIARQILEEGNFSLMTDGAIPYADANRLFTPAQKS